MRAIKNTFWGKSGDSLAAPDAPKLKHTFDLSTDPKPGFLGNLTNEQYTILETFKKHHGEASELCVDARSPVSFSAGEDVQLFEVKDGAKEDSVVRRHLTEVDSFLLRFLRGRQFDLEKASLMIENYFKWRVSFHVKEICEVVRFPWVPALRMTYPHGYHGVDKIGRPLYIERIGKADITAVLKLASLDHLLAYWVQQYEYVRQVILPACSIAAGRRIEQGVSIIDLSGLGFSHCGSQSRHVMRQLAKLSQDYFPEMLGTMIVVNAPTVFGPVWSFAKTLIDERTVSKITLLTSRSSHWTKYVQQLVDADQLPQFLGGTAPNESWDSNYLGPWRDPSILKVMEERYPTLSKQFIHFDISKGDENSLKALEGIPEVPASGVDNGSFDEAFSKLGSYGSGEEELGQIEQAGVQVI